MKLSDLNTTPRYPITVPSTGTKTTFRPFFVREERALLTAQESDDIGVMLSTMESITRNCVDKLPANLTTFDLEYLMTHIRAKSVGENSVLMFKCDTCIDEKAVATVSIDLTQVKVHDSKPQKNIKLNDNLTAVMKYPSVSDLVNVMSSDDKELCIIRSCLDKLHTAEETFDLAEESDAEVEDFVATLTSYQKKQIQYFIDNVPYTYITAKYTCPVCGKHHERELKGINNFF